MYLCMCMDGSHEPIQRKRWAQNNIYRTFPFILEFRAGKKCTVIKCSLVITFVGGKIWERHEGKFLFFFLILYHVITCTDQGF